MRAIMVGLDEPSDSVACFIGVDVQGIQKLADIVEREKFLQQLSRVTASFRDKGMSVGTAYRIRRRHIFASVESGVENAPENAGVRTTYGGGKSLNLKK
ncbi:MAG: hypothetical protein Q9163_002190 [Psora crenata]